MHRGAGWATAASRPLPRVFGLRHAAADDVPPESFVWMPSHKGGSDVGRVLLSNGDTLTERDRFANDFSDRHARAVARSVRVEAHVRQAIESSRETTYTVARWIGMATHLANAHDGPVTRDSTASRQGRGRAAPRVVVVGGGCAPPPSHSARLTEPRPPALGGHVLVFHGSVVSCVVCRRHSRKVAAFVRGRCPGSAAARWAERAEADAQLGIGAGGGHHRLLSGEVVWCSRCGSYASSLARGLTRACRAPPPPWR